MSRKIDPDKDFDEYTDEELQYALDRDWFETEEEATRVKEYLDAKRENADDEDPENEDGLMDESVPDLRTIAEEEEVDLSGLKRKKEIVKAIRDARASVE